MNTTTAQEFFPPGKGTPPPFSVVPEPAFYGFVLVGLCVALAWLRLRK